MHINLKQWYFLRSFQEMNININLSQHIQNLVNLDSSFDKPPSKGMVEVAGSG